MSSVKTRLAAAAGLLACAAIVAVAVALRQGTRQDFFRFQEFERQGTAARLHGDAQRLAAALDGRCCSAEAMAAIGEVPGGRAVLVVDANGSVLAQQGPALAGLRDLRTRTEGSTLLVTAVRPHGQRLERIQLHFAGTGVPLALAGGERGVLHLIGVPPREVEVGAERFLGSLDRTILWATVLAGAAAVALTWLLARRALRPVDDLRAAARAIARGELAHRAPVAGDDELGELAQAFNAMAAQLERQETLRRNLLHDVAHELRTPLTALRCRIETIADGLAADPVRAVSGAAEEVVHLGHLVDDLQELALAEAGELRLNIAETAVAPVINSAITAAGLSGDSRVQIDSLPGAVVRADAVRLRQILLNLLTNAGRHTPHDGRIVVGTRQDGGDLIIEVANTGSTLDDGQRALVFDRFYRTDPSRHRTTGGSGLGLAIVKTLVEAQGGRVWVISDESGVVFGCALPAGG